MVGNPWRQQSYYHNIRKFFPQFCFGSSFFLFLTMLYYCTTLNQRRNIHTYSMICFLFSMMIVQLDIGIAFSIAARTCVCAFIREYRRTYHKTQMTNCPQSLPQELFQIRINRLDDRHGLHYMESTHKVN